MTAARAVVERTVHGATEHTYGVNTGFGRFVKTSRSRRSSPRSSSSGCCARTPAGSATRIRTRSCAPRCCSARTRSRRAPRARAWRPSNCCSRACNRGLVPRVPARGSVGASGDLAPLAHLALPLVGEGEATVDGTLPRRRGSRPGRARAGPAPGEGRAVARERDAVHVRARPRSALVRARRLAKTADLACTLSLEALQGSRTSFIPQIDALRPMRGQLDSAANVHRLLEGSAIIEAHRWCSQVQDAYSLRCAPQVHGASRDLLDYVEGVVADRVERGDRQPARARRRGHARLQRELPRPAARVRARRARDGGRRAGEHLGAPRRTPRQPVAVAAASPRSSPPTAASTRGS